MTEKFSPISSKELDEQKDILAKEENELLRQRAENEQEAISITSEKENLNNSTQKEVDSFIEENLVEISDQDIEKAKYDEWKGMGKRYTTLDKLSIDTTDKIAGLNLDLATATKYSEVVSVDYIDDPTKIPDWDTLPKDEQDGMIEYAHIVKQLAELKKTQEYLQIEKDAAMDMLKTNYDLSSADIETKLSINGDDEITEDDIILAQKSLLRRYPAKEDTSHSEII